MGHLVYTSNIPFDMSDWAKENFVKVVAGTGCIMGLTAEGEARQVIRNPHRAIREDYWYGLKDIAVSKIIEGAAIGLMKDGTCQIGKRAIRDLLGRARYAQPEFERINAMVKSWKNIVQVAASDAFFALDEAGRVHYIGINHSDVGYLDIKSWENVAKVVPFAGSDGVFGITKDGRVLGAGWNVTRGPMGDILNRLAELRDVTDIASAGSEGERILYTKADGTVWDLREGKLEGATCAPSGQTLEGQIVSNLIRNGDGTITAKHYNYCPYLEEVSAWQNVSAMALGDQDFMDVFAIAILE